MRDQSSRPNSHKPLIIAHRGASALAPENTLAAFARAFADAADGLELDVRLARDGVPVVIHDSSLRRTGLSPNVVEQMTSKELSQVDVGSWFNMANPRAARTEYSRERVATLADVLRFAEQAGQSGRNRAVIYVELKSEEGAIARDLIKTTLELVRDYGLCGQAVVISFDLKAVALTKQMDPAIRTGALFSPRTRSSAAIRKRQLLASAKDCGADEILLHHLLASRRTIELAIENNLSPVVWTVDHEAWVRRANAWKIHALITNNPAKLKAATT